MSSKIYRGRFAPSPTGPLHIGSMYAALGSYLQAKHQNGQWFVRIEDLDPPREQKDAAELILFTLKKFGLFWDKEQDEDVVFQSQRSQFYEQALSKLQDDALIYRCVCSRKKIKTSAKLGPIGFIYPGTCRNKNIPSSSTRSQQAIRLKVVDCEIIFNDLLQGEKHQFLSKEIGDIILKRADGLYAYHLAVVVDDYLQGITEVVRGFDLFDCTPIHIQLQTYLNYPTPSYVHLPLLTNEKNEKLSKQTKASAVDINCVEPLLFLLLHYLNQNPPKKLQHESKENILAWAIEHWDLKAVSLRQKNSNFIHVNDSPIRWCDK